GRLCLPAGPTPLRIWPDFFFQAEDGIRDFHVTGVQTCALPILPAALANGSIAGYIVAEPFNAAAEVMEVGKILRFTGDVWLRHRSEERRVGKDWRAGWERDVWETKGRRPHCPRHRRTTRVHRRR